MADAVLTIRNLKQRYRQGDRQLEVLKDVSLTLQRGEIVGLLGNSGAGKSTLLHAAGLLEAPSSGEIFLQDTPCHTLSASQRNTLRGQKIGFVYQFHHLLPEFTALENVAMPLLLQGVTKLLAYKEAAVWLGRVGLAERHHHRPAKLSGGEQQRVALARALVHKPLLLLADEPTGNLDPDTAQQVFQLLTTQAREHKLTALIATHNHELAAAMDRTMVMKGGSLRSEV